MRIPGTAVFVLTLVVALPNGALAGEDAADDALPDTLLKLASDTKFHVSANTPLGAARKLFGEEENWRSKARALGLDVGAGVTGNAADDALPDTLPGSPGTRDDLSVPGTVTFWGTVNRARIENTYNDLVLEVDSRHDGRIYTYTLGADYRVSDRVVAGLAVSRSRTDITNTHDLTNYDEDGHIISPYVAYLSDETSGELHGGIGTGDVKMWGAEVLAINRISSFGTMLDSRTVYLQGAVRHRLEPFEDEALEVTPSLSGMLARKRLSAFTDSLGRHVRSTITNIFQLRPEIEAAYRFEFEGGGVLRPSFNGAVLYDMLDSVNDDSDAYVLGGGLSYDAGNGLFSSLDYEREMGRDEYLRHSVTAALSYAFRLGPYDSLTPDIGYQHTLADGLQQSYGLAYRHQRRAHSYGLGMGTTLGSGRPGYDATADYQWTPVPGLSVSVRAGFTDLKDHSVRTGLNLEF